MSSNIIIDPGVLSINRIIKLNKKFNDQIILMTAHHELLTSFKKRDKNINIYLYPHVNKKDNLPEIKNLKLDPVMVWQKIINDHQTFLLYDRSKFLPFSSSLKVSNIIDDILRCIFWFEKMKPKYLIYMFMPHSLETWIFACVSEFYGAKVLYFQRTVIPWRFLFFQGLQEDPVLADQENMSKSKKNNETAIFKEFYNKKIGDIEYITPKYELDKLKKNRNKFYNFYIDFYKSWPRIDLFLNKFFCYHFYKKMSERINFKEKYVIYFMHYQPERTTLPESFGFAQQYGAISTISMALPKGIKLYIKEHPSIFTFSCHWKERTISWYKKILKLKNVKFVSLKENSYELIDKSICVSTISGTVAGEAIVRGKKAIIFSNGQMHFVKSDLLHKYKSFKELKQFIKKAPMLKFNLDTYYDKLKSVSFNGLENHKSFEEVESDFSNITHNAMFNGIEKILKVK